MSAQKQHDKFEVDEDSDYQRIEWKTERVGWIVWTLLIAAALVGLLGSGPFSSTEISSSDRRLAVEYERIGRRQAAGEIRVRISPQLVHEGQLRLRTSANFIENEAIERIQPEPREVLYAGGMATHVFPVAAGAESPVITFRLSPTRIGRHEYIFGVEGGPEVRFRVIVLP